MPRLPLLAALSVLALSTGTAAAAEQPRRAFFGVGPQTALGPADVKRMAAGGVGTLRLEFPWYVADVDAPAGGFDWTDFDPVVEEAARAGITIVPVLYGTPEWVSRIDGHDGCAECRIFLPTGDLALNAWEVYVGSAVGRYGPGGSFWLNRPNLEPRPIRAWQIWNEQNSGQYTYPQSSVRPYAKLVRSASRAIRSVDPAGKVILGGMFGSPVSPTVNGVAAELFLKRLYRRRGIENHFEGIAAHPYSARFGDVQRQVEALRTVAEEAGDPRVETWITEIGWASGGIAHPLNKGEAGQAEMLRRAFRLFIAKRREWRVKLVSWFSWRDSTTAPICQWCPESGLFDSAYGLKPKPAWHAYISFSGGA